MMTASVPTQRPPTTGSDTPRIPAPSFICNGHYKHILLPTNHHGHVSHNDSLHRHERADRGEPVHPVASIGATPDVRLLVDHEHASFSHDTQVEIGHRCRFTKSLA